MQRKLSDHTKYMVRARSKCKMDEEIFEHWSGSKRERLYELLYEYSNMGDYKGWTVCHHLLPTPQSWSTVISEGSRIPEHYARV
jgi:hypothetical protein